MYKRLSAIMFPIMTILFIGAMYWGYQENQEKNAVLLKAENQYQRAFGNLTHYMNQLNEQLGNTLAVNSTSKDFHRKGLVNVWRITGDAQNEIAQLPLNYLPFVDAQNFLSRVSNFAYKTAVRDLTKQPLSEDEFSTLKTLYANSQQIYTDLSDLQQNIMKSSMRWMDVEVALSINEAETLNPVVSSMRSVNDGISKYPELDWGPAVNSMYNDDNIELLSGTLTNAEEVKKLASEFTHINSNEFQVQENGKDSDYATFTAIAKPENDEEFRLTFTAKGGKLITYIHSRDVSVSELSIEQGKQMAEKFIDEHDYRDMIAVNYNDYDHAGTYTFVTKKDDVLIYPDQVTVKVALDNGEILGFHSSEYASHHAERTIKEPAISASEALKALNPNFRIQQQRKALIKGDMGTEVLCYEFTGVINDVLYRIYMNSETGMEEKIEKLTRQDLKVTD